MPRSKGSKNKTTRVKKPQWDEQLAAEQAEKERLEHEKAELTAVVEENTARLKETSKKLRAVDRRIAKLEAKRAEAEAAAASAAKRVEIQQVITRLLDSGVAEDDILEKLNK